MQPRPFTDGRIVVSAHAYERYCERIEEASHAQIEALVRKAVLFNTREARVASHRFRHLAVGEMLVVCGNVCFVVCRDGDSNVVVTCWKMDDPPDARVRLPREVFADEDVEFERMSPVTKRLKRRNPGRYRGSEYPRR